MCGLTPGRVSEQAHCTGGISGGRKLDRRRLTCLEKRARVADECPAWRWCCRNVNSANKTLSEAQAQSLLKYHVVPG